MCSRKLLLLLTLFILSLTFTPWGAAPLTVMFSAFSWATEPAKNPGASPGGEGRPAPAPAVASRQAIVVKTADWLSLRGTMQRYERSLRQDKWRPVGRAVPVSVGRNGLGWGMGLHPEGAATSFSARKEASKRLTDNESAPMAGKGHRWGSENGKANDRAPVKREGDGRAPAGIFSLSGAFGYAPVEECRWIKMPYQEATPSLRCIDDVTSRYYNRLVHIDNVEDDWSSCEEMHRPDQQYRLGVIVDHNAVPPIPGRGSCIFIHIWQGPDRGTAGCTAMSPENMEMILRWLDPAAFPVLIQLPETTYRRLRSTWKLP